MVSFPVRLPPSGYSGRDPKKLLNAEIERAAAARIEEYINNTMAELTPGEARCFDNWEIARETGIDIDVVARLIYARDCGSNGITVYKGSKDTGQQD